MLLLLAGLLVLCGLLLLGWLFVNTDPRRLARWLKWGAVGVGGAVLLALIVTGRITILLAPLMAMLPLLRRMRSLFGGLRGPAPGRSSEAASAYLRMSLDHDTGAMSGTVLQGTFAGMRLEELALPDLLALLRECRAADEDGARLLEAYLDRLHPDWRDDLAGTRKAEAPTPPSPDVTVEEAYAILGLSSDADAAEVKAAHHRLMKQLHPDHGGTDYLATKINRARDVLLRR